MNVSEKGSRRPEDTGPAASGLTAAWQWFATNKAGLAANALAGAVASLLTIAYCLSFAVLLFQGPLVGGLAAGLWAFLVGSAVAGFYVALTTSLPPAEAGPDNPAAAVLSVLSGTVSGAVFAAGGSAALAVDHVLLSFSLATLVTGLVLYVLGRLKLGQYVRFIPYPVIGGFLAASGWLLVTGGVEVMIGRDVTLAGIGEGLPPGAWPMLLIGGTFAAVVFTSRVYSGNIYALPVAFVGGSVVLDVALWLLGLDGGQSTWFVRGASHLDAWVPLKAMLTEKIDWSIYLKAATEIAACAGVTVIALLLDVTGLEVSRTKSGDLDWEFRTNGVANIVAAPLGGVMGNLSLNGSRLLDETGGLQRISGVFASLAVVLVVATGIDLPGVVPKPILAGLLIYLGLVVLSEVLLHSPAHRAWTDFALALAIMVAIVAAGYLAGIVFGFVAACLMFAFNYSRVAVIRRHLTRRVIASNMDRSGDALRLLEEEGDRLHVFWLSGFIFFGSANGVFENVLASLGAARDGKQRFAVLDLADVSGFDTSALLSLVKLRNFADDNRATLAFAGAPQQMIASLEHLRVLGENMSHRSFSTRNGALEWCEDRILAERGHDARPGTEVDLVEWLAAEVGGRERAQRLAVYFVRRALPAGALLYAQGSAADRIDLLVAGTLAVTVAGEPGAQHVVRRMSTRTVVGEMGFFRNDVRMASVAAQEGATFYSLDREAYERLRAQEPEICAAFLEFIVRALADRLQFANDGIAALS